MSTKKFNETLDSIFMGLFKDSLTNVAYDYVKELYDEFSNWVEDKSEEVAQMKFIELVRQDAQFRQCIKAKDTADLHSIALKICNEKVSGALREITTSLAAHELFKADADKKMWKRIQKLVYACNLQRIVTGEEASTTARSKMEKRSEEVSHIVQSRITRFNTAYRQLLVTLSTAFPEENGQPSTECLDSFDELVEGQDSIIIESFKKRVLPMVPEIAKTFQGDASNDPESHAKVFHQYFGRNSHWFKKLPLIDLLPIDLHWESQMYVGVELESLYNEFFKLPHSQREQWFEGHPEVKETFQRIYDHQITIMKALGDLACCMSGLDTLIYSPIIAVLKEKAKEHAEKNNIQPSQLLPNSDDFDRGVAMGLVMSLLDAIPEATNNKITKQDMETLISNTLSGRLEYPESFNEVFSPDMIDMDCLDCVADLPGIGDVVSPLMVGMQGQMKGVTGEKSAFGSVAAPAWLERE